MPNAPWHATPAFKATRAQLQHLARLHPDAICWRCGQTLGQHQPHRNGKPATWHAGHTGDRWNWTPWLHVTTQPPPGDYVALEASTCNLRAAADQTNGTHHFDPSIIAQHDRT